MLTANSYSPFDNSVANAKTVVGMEWVFEGLKKQLNTLSVVLLLPLLLTVAYPLYLLCGVWVHYMRKRFLKSMKKPLPAFQHSEHYATFKEATDKLSRLKPALKKLDDLDIKSVPWLLRYTPAQMQKMSSTLVTFEGWLQTRLDCLNTQQLKSNSNLFKFRPEKELWEKRNKVYQYWM